MWCYFGEFNIGLANNPLIDIFFILITMLLFFPSKFCLKKTTTKTNRVFEFRVFVEISVYFRHTILGDTFNKLSQIFKNFRVFGSVAEYFEFEHPLVWFVGKWRLWLNFHKSCLNIRLYMFQKRLEKTSDNWLILGLLKGKLNLI